MSEQGSDALMSAQARQENDVRIAEEMEAVRVEEAKTAAQPDDDDDGEGRGR